jgi:general secretion pathway protein I
MRTLARSAPRAQAGFTLLEVIVAFVLLALTLATVFQVFSAGLARASDLDEYAKALVIAQSRMASVGIEDKLERHESQGESDDHRYRWAVRVEPYEEVREGAAQPQGSVVMFKVDSVVGWRAADGREREVRLSTLQVGPRT